ncbi:MAG TPA: OmpA family protein [Edaphobacter sp.]|nr:OmpA family protein [Edaphobacter sp.]
MRKTTVSGIAFFATTTLAAILSLCGLAVAQTTEVQGVIDGRSGATMTVKSQESGSDVVVLLTDSTQVNEVEGALHMRKKQMGMTALVPGLPVQVKGSSNAQNQLVADTVRFKGSDLKTAQDIQAGVAPVEQQTQTQQQQMAQQEKQIQGQSQALQQQQQEMAAAQAKIDANKAAIAAANKRFGELGDYNILGEVTVLFANGKVALEPQYKPQLMDLIQKAKTINAFVIQVKGYASSVGSAALNQKLSTERADNVTDFLEQNGIPLTNMLAPGAMGTSKQVAPDTSAEGQAENRRVVVRILQNKGIAGT